MEDKQKRVRENPGTLIPKTKDMKGIIKQLDNFEHHTEAVQAFMAAIEEYHALVAQGKHRQAKAYKRVLVQTFTVKLALSATQIAAWIVIYKAIGPVSFAAKVGALLGSWAASRIAISPLNRLDNRHTLKRLDALRAKAYEIDAALDSYGV